MVPSLDSCMVSNEMGAACTSLYVVLRCSRSPSVVADHHFGSLCKLQLSIWKNYPNFLTLVLFFPLMLMAYALLTLWLTLLPPAPLNLMVTWWDFYVFVFKKHCVWNSLCSCVFTPDLKKPIVMWRCLEVTSVHWVDTPRFPLTRFFVDLHCTTHRCQWNYIEIVW